MGWRPLRRWALILAVLITCAGCTGLPRADSATLACQPPDRSSDLATVDGLYVLPGDGRQPLLDKIERAVCTIDITVYLLTDEVVIDALDDAEARGVEVRLMYEETPFGGSGNQLEVRETLIRSGAEVRGGPNQFRFTHAKYMVIDGQVAIITNQNITYSSFESNREFGVITTDMTNVATVAGIFEADWNGTVAPAPAERLVVSPENSRESIVEMIDSADRSLRLYVEVIRDDGVVDALSQAVQRGVQVRIIGNAPDDDLDRTVNATLQSNGVEIRSAGHIYIHAKALVIDDSVVLIGSHNPTATSLDDNREISLIVTDAVAIARVAATFDSDWNQSSPLGN